MGHEEVQREVLSGFEAVSIDTWLSVIPQLIARIHTRNKLVHEQLHTLLSRFAKSHPQALIYNLVVAKELAHARARQRGGQHSCHDAQE